MSIAHRFGREGYAVELVSRTDTRHAGYLRELAEAGITARAHTADVQDRDRTRAVLDDIAERHDGIGVVYYGPSGLDPSGFPAPITEVDSAAVAAAMDQVVYPAIDVARLVLPGMVERGAGGLLFAGGLSALVPMPALGRLAVAGAALRNYALTLNAALSGQGVYAGTVIIGGLIARSDIHAFAAANPGQLGDAGARLIDPDEIADGAWDLYAKRDRAEVVFDVITQG